MELTSGLSLTPINIAMNKTTSASAQSTIREERVLSRV